LFFEQIYVEGGFKNTALLANYMTQPWLDEWLPCFNNSNESN